MEIKMFGQNNLKIKCLKKLNSKTISDDTIDFIFDKMKEFYKYGFNNLSLEEYNNLKENGYIDFEINDEIQFIVDDIKFFENKKI